MRHLSLTAVSLLTAILVIAGCATHPHHGTRPSAKVSVTVSAAQSSASPRTAILDAVAAYRAMWTVYTAASNSGTVNPPELARYASGTALQVLDQGLARNKQKGLTSRGVPKIAPQVTSSGPTDAPTSVTIGDCVDGTDWLLYTGDGNLADNIPGGKHKTTATVDKADGRWTVTALALQGTGTC